MASWERSGGRAAGATAALLIVLALGGCLGPTGPGGEPGPLVSISVYEYRYPGDDVFHPEHAYGWMSRLTNVAPFTVWVTAVPDGEDHVSFGHVTPDGVVQSEERQPLLPGESVLYVFHWQGADVDKVAYRVSVAEPGRLDPDTRQPADFHITETERFERALRKASTHTPVKADDHVLTATVGVWVDGRSFYTNIPALNKDPDFPAGYDREEFGGDPLPIYVYDAAATEQPPGSRDNCRFVTIPGYNALLKTQAQTTTNVRFLTPEEAYTREGNEEHSLYGDALIFMNTIVAHDGEVGPIGGLPDPQAPCFDLEHTTGPLPVPLPPA